MGVHFVMGLRRATTPRSFATAISTRLAALLRRFPRLNLGAASFLLLAMFSSASFAGVIYEYRQVGSPTVIGTLEIAPSSELIALFLDNAVFGLGSANLLFVGGTLTNLDGGGIQIKFPTIFPVVSTDPTIDQTLVVEMGPSLERISLE